MSVGLGESFGFAGHSEGVAQPMVVVLTAPIQSSVQRSTGSYEVEMGLGVGGCMGGEVQALTFYSYNITRTHFHISQKFGEQNCI